MATHRPIKTHQPTGRAQFPGSAVNGCGDDAEPVLVADDQQTNSGRSSRGHGSVPVDPTCASPDNRTDSGDRLPHTGGPVTSWVGLAAVATAVTSLALLLRPRRRRT
jgi:LPXTG-motif cell wall-anchored protein